MKATLAVLVAVVAAGSAQGQQINPAQAAAADRIAERRALYRRIAMESGPIEAKFMIAERRYQRVAVRVSACRIGRYQSAFADTFKTIDTVRASLESGNDAIKEKRRAANKVFSEQENKKLELDMEYANKPRDDAYYNRLTTITHTVNNDYAAIMADVVNPGYVRYTDGIDQITDAYDRYATECASNPRGRQMSNLVREVGSKIDLANVAANALKRLLGIA